jgi:hypothetical protein
LAEDFLSEEASRMTKKDRMLAFFFVILGGKALAFCLNCVIETDTHPAIGMSIVGAFA